MVAESEPLHDEAQLLHFDLLQMRTNVLATVSQNLQVNYILCGKYGNLNTLKGRWRLIRLLACSCTSNHTDR